MEFGVLQKTSKQSLISNFFYIERGDTPSHTHPPLGTSSLDQGLRPCLLKLDPPSIISWIRPCRYVVNACIVISLVAKWAILTRRGFVVFTNFYDWFMFTGPSWIRISRVPDWHAWGKFIMSKKQNGRQMLPWKLNNVYNFPNISLRDLILVSNYMFSISRNTMEHILYD